MSKELIDRLKSYIPSGDGHHSQYANDLADAVAILEAKAAPVGERDSVTVLPDGSAFGVVSFPLPRDHWLYAEREYDDGADQPKELPAPILTHELRSAVEAAVRYAVRGATDCGKESDFDPDALVQNAVYALCGPFGAAHQRQQAREVVMPDDLSELLTEIVDIHRRRGVVLTIHIEQIADMLARLNGGSHE